MKLAIASVVLAGCWAHDSALQKQVDDLTAQLAQTQKELDRVRHQVEELQKPHVEVGSSEGKLDRKLDELDKKIDQLAAAPRPPAPSRPSRPEPDRGKVYALAVDGYPSEGPADAKVTIVMAHDYADPYSEKMRATLADLRKKYGKDLRIVYRDFVVHPQVATAAALAACAAHDQKKFAALDTLLWDKGFKVRNFDHDVELPDGTAERCWKTADGCAVVLDFAKEAKLDVAKLKAQMPKCETKLQADMRELQAFGVGATPTFFINGRYIVGAMPSENFETLIDEELEKAKQRISSGTKPAAYYKTWVLDKGLTKLETP